MGKYLINDYQNYTTMSTFLQEDITFEHTKLCKHSDGSILLGVTWKSLSKMEIENWEMNRPFDSVRIPDIVEQLKKQNYVDGIIYLVCKNNKLICYDGIHRIEALKRLSSKDPTTNHSIVIHYYPVYREETIIQKFIVLNKCVPVPQVYTTAHRELDRRNKIESIIKHFHSNYNKMFTSSSRPKIPHENRDVFTDKIDDIMKELDIYSERSDDIIGAMEKYNEQMRDYRCKVKLSKKQLDKCEKNGCYIFIRKDWKYNFVRFYRKHYT